MWIETLGSSSYKELWRAKGVNKLGEALGQVGEKAGIGRGLIHIEGAWKSYPQLILRLSPGIRTELCLAIPRGSEFHHRCLMQQ